MKELLREMILGIDPEKGITRRVPRVGLSKLARLVDVFAKRPQVQERMTEQIADQRGDAHGQRRRGQQRDRAFEIGEIRFGKACRRQIGRAHV